MLKYFRKVEFMPFLVNIKFKITKTKLIIVKINNCVISILNNPIRFIIIKAGNTIKHMTNKNMEVSLFTSLVFDKTNDFLSIKLSSEEKLIFI